jgi:VWFA-related protein
MRIKQASVGALYGLLLAAPMIFGQVISAEAIASATKASSADENSGVNITRESGLYADGMRAINEGRWSDAVAIFTKVVGEPGEHADGALYWKAYSENKQGQSNLALDTCLELRRDHPKSRWIDECGALEIEIRAKSGQPIQPQAEHDDELKLLALNSLMEQDELRALPGIEQILNGDVPETVKEHALFIVAHGQSKQAQDLLEQIAQNHANAVLQAKAAEMLLNRRDHRTDSAVPATNNPNRAIRLNVVVTDKSGKRVTGLQPQDFTLLDNKEARDILSVHAEETATGRTDGGVEVILLIDGINSSFNSVANTREELVKYLRQNGGHLALPTSFIFLSDAGTQIGIQPTRDGNALIAELVDNSSGLRTFAQGLYRGEERWQLSLTALDRIAPGVGKRPGRKLLVWISPGWPAFSRLGWLNSKNYKQSLFDYIVRVSTALREAGITIYSIDPEGVGRDQFYYENFLKGVGSVNKADNGDLLLQVLAFQSGGLVFSGGNDIGNLIDRCVADANGYYMLTFDSPPASYPNEYHGIEVLVHKQGIKIRTRTGYYAQP